MLTGSWDDTIRLWDVKTGQEAKRFSGHSSFEWSVAFSPDGQSVLTGSWDGTARLWDVKTGECLWVTSLPYWSEETWGWDDVIVWLQHIFLFIIFPMTRFFDKGRILYIRKPNPYLQVYDIPGVEKWLPPGWRQALIEIINCQYH